MVLSQRICDSLRSIRLEAVAAYGISHGETVQRQSAVMGYPGVRNASEISFAISSPILLQAKFM